MVEWKLNDVGNEKIEQCISGCFDVKGWYEGKIEDLSMKQYEWGMDIMAVTETQLRERVDMCCDKHRMIGNGRSKWMKRGGGIG